MALKIIFVLGGAKSGKSSFALTQASGVKGKKAFIATAEALDGEMKERISRHKAERGDEWDTYEEPLNVSKVLSETGDKYSVVLIDCLTLWLSNIMHHMKDTEGAINKFIDELDRSKDLSTVYMVSNEVGTGIVPENDLARKFRDLAGNLNQRIAGISEEVYLVVAGIPLKIK
ncbi:bifunctional adenosylcobalamin biosynthesis protein CobP [bacterium BMS3Bbin09]|nr:bifunctional adenosylcobalamin biosynthesis protein CobP [bacterium BMS3Bbin09]